MSRGAAATLEVGPAGAFTTVQEALAVAANGDLIEIAAGDYEGPLVLGAVEVEIVGVDGSAATRIFARTDLPSSLATVMINAASPITLRGLTLDGSDQQRGLFARDADLFGEDLVFTGGAGEFSADLTVQTSVVTLVGASFDDPIAAVTGGHGEVISSTLDFEAVSFRNATITDGIGGGLYLYDTEATFRGCTFADNSAAEGGALFIEALPSNLILFEDTVFERNSAISGPGGAIFQLDGQLQLIRTTVRDSDATDVGGGIAHLGARDFLFHDGVVERCHSLLGGGIALLDGTAAVVTRSTFTDNLSDGDGGAVMVLGHTGAADVGGNLFCGNSGVGGGGVMVSAGTDLAATIHHNRFVANSATLRGGALAAVGISADVHQNTVVDSRTAGDLGALYVGPGSLLAVATNNAYSQNSGGAVYIDAIAGLDGGYNLYFSNDFNIGTPDGAQNDGTWSDVLAPAGFQDYTADDCASNLRPSADSALIDAGDPADLDGDGTRSDIGAYGGPGASELLDVDGDGVIEGDCAPFDPEKLTGTEEVVADGIDQDCDGLDLCWIDDDEDGVGISQTIPAAIGCETPGTAPVDGDCDDTNAELAADCTPVDDTGEAPDDPEEPPDDRELQPAWFCSATGRPPAISVLTWWVAALLARRRGGRTTVETLVPARARAR